MLHRLKKKFPPDIWRYLPRRDSKGSLWRKPVKTKLKPNSDKSIVIRLCNKRQAFSIAINVSVDKPCFFESLHLRTTAYYRKRCKRSSEADVKGYFKQSRDFLPTCFERILHILTRLVTYDKNSQVSFHCGKPCDA